MKDSGGPFAILSLDGGGARGYLTSRVLRNIETHLNRRDSSLQSLGSRFDFIVGTSTGGLIALCLAAGISAGEIFQCYANSSSEIFSRPKNKFCRWLSPKYENKGLRRVAGSLLQEKTLADLVIDACITSVSLSNASPRFHKSDFASRNDARLDEKLVDIALATSAAPTYFPAHSTAHSTSLVDGGICANNPTMVGIVDALQFERPSKRGRSPPSNIADGLKNMIVLSVGTGKEVEMPYDHAKLASAGKARWANNIWQVILQSQSTLIENQASFLLNERYHRKNPDLPFKMELDETGNLKDLDNLSDLSAADVEFIETHL